MILYESQYYGVCAMDIDPIEHHGIKGQKWGVTNGPPYPLGFKARQRVRERAKAIREKLSGGKKSGSKRGLSDKTKARIKTGLKVAGTAAVVGAAAYGAYKLSDLRGTGALETNAGNIKNLASAAKLMRDDYSKSIEELNTGKMMKDLPEEKIPKTIDDMFGKLTDDNPLKKDPNVKDNCTNVFLAAIGRAKGKDVRPGWQLDQNGKFTTCDVEDVCACFANRTDSLGNDMLKRRSGSDCDSYEKVCKVLNDKRYKYPNGSVGYLQSVFTIGGKDYTHAVTWTKENDEIKFGDGIYGTGASAYFNSIKKDANVYFFRADNHDLIDEEYRKHVIYN